MGVFPHRSRSSNAMVRLNRQVTEGLASMYTCCMLQLLVCSKHPSVCSASHEFQMVMCDRVIVTSQLQSESEMD